MRVLFLTNIPSPYRVDFFNELGKLCELTVVFERESAADRNANWKSDKPKYYEEIFLKGINISQDKAFSLSIVKFLDKNKFDVFIIGGYATPTAMLAIEILKSKRIPFILNCDGGIIKNDARLKYKIKKHFISSASSWLSTGENTTQYLLHYGAKKGNINVYPFTSLKSEDILEEILTKEQKQCIRKELDIKEEKVIVSVGQFIHRKGFDILLNACKNVDKNIGIYIIGGEPTEEYIALKEKLKLSNAHFIGFKNKEELKRYYKAADLFVMPTREDIWGLVINEAMSYGLPVITTEKCVAGLELIKSNENGFIIPTDNEKQLWEKISFILSDNKLCNQMSLITLKKIRRYTIENMAKEHEKYLNIFFYGK